MTPSVIPVAEAQAPAPVQLPAAPVSIDLSKFSESTSLSEDQLRAVLLKAGFKEKQLHFVVALARAESGWRPKALNWTSVDRSYGIFQINMIGRVGRARIAQYGMSSPDDLFDPLLNAKVAYAMSNGGTNWWPWGAYANGSYKKYL